MPDDKKTEEIVVTEQNGEIDTAKGAKEALEGFNTPDDDERKPVEDKQVPEQKPEEKPEEKIEKEGEVQEKTDEEVSEEEDEDLKRGQEILDHEAKRKEEEDKFEAEQARLEAEEAERRKPDVAPYTVDDIRVFKNVVPDAIFPDEIEVDGNNINLKEFLEDTPEVKTISAIVAKNIVDTLLKNNYIPHYSVMEQKINEAEDRLLYKMFVDRITDRTHGVPEAIEIVNSKEFKTWLDKQDAKIQALRRSGEEKDHIKMLKRFLKDAGLAKADEKVTNLDKKRSDKKKAVDAVYTTTARSKKSAVPSASIGQSARDEALAGFNEPDDED